MRVKVGYIVKVANIGPPATEVSDEDYRKAELVLMNTRAIIGPQHINRIYKEWGSEAIDILYSLVEERGKLIETVGDLKTELSKLQRENGELRKFRDTIIKEALKAKPQILPPEGNRC